MDPDRVPPLSILQQHRPEDEQRHDGPGEQNAALHPGPAATNSIIFTYHFVKKKPIGLHGE